LSAATETFSVFGGGALITVSVILELPVLPAGIGHFGRDRVRADAEGFGTASSRPDLTVNAGKSRSNWPCKSPLSASVAVPVNVAAEPEGRVEPVPGAVMTTAGGLL